MVVDDSVRNRATQAQTARRVLIAWRLLAEP